jgi:hypothetical protein
VLDEQKERLIGVETLQSWGCAGVGHNSLRRSERQDPAKITADAQSKFPGRSGLDEAWDGTHVEAKSAPKVLVVNRGNNIKQSQ